MAGQCDCDRHDRSGRPRSATRDWTIDSNAVAPTVTIEQPARHEPPFAVPAITTEPGGKMTFSGTAADDEGLKDVEVALRNSTHWRELFATTAAGAPARPATSGSRR